MATKAPRTRLLQANVISAEPDTTLWKLHLLGGSCGCERCANMSHSVRSGRPQTQAAPESRSPPELRLREEIAGSRVDPSRRPLASTEPLDIHRLAPESPEAGSTALIKENEPRGPRTPKTTLPQVNTTLSQRDWEF